MYLLIFSYLLDLVFGDPEWIFHPVRVIGKLIDKLESALIGRRAIWIERLKGIVLVALVVITASVITYFLLKVSLRINVILGDLVWIYMAYTVLSIKDLGVKARAVSSALRNSHIEKARHELSKIVGRDTGNLDQKEIIKAAIESVAENTNDGIVAPLFYLILGGPVLAIAYKAVNTLDSMIGYKNEKYIHFGWCAAHLDDIANFIPARISGFLISISSKNFRDSFKIMLRDGSKHSSPNSGISEAAMAGALGIKLGGGTFYQGVFVPKPYIGIEKREINNNLIIKALKISFVTSILMLILGVIFKWLA